MPFSPHPCSPNGHFAMSPVPVFETVYYVAGTVRINIMCVHVLSHVQVSATPQTVARQAPLSMGLSWQECWSRLPFPSPGDLPDPGNEPRSPTLQADSLPSEPQGIPLENSMRYPQKLTVELPYDLEVPLQGIYLKKSKIYLKKIFVPPYS